MKRKQIEETLERSLDNIVGDIQEAIEWLESMKKDGWKTMDFDWGWESLIFTRYRLETDKELAKRKKDLQKQKNRKRKTKSPY